MKPPPLVLATIILATSGCAPAPHQLAPKPAPPANVERPGKESDLATITLTAAAEKRLGIKTAAVEIRSIARMRTVGGEATLPSGAAITVTAPFTGTLVAPEGRPAPHCGQNVTGDRPILTLKPILAPESGVSLAAAKLSLATARLSLRLSQIDAEGAIMKARAEIDAARIRVARALKLLSEQAGSQRALDDARAELQIAEAALRAAAGKQSALAALSLVEPSVATETIDIKSPVNGVLWNLFVAPGQIVAAGTKLFEVMDPSRMWVRVPVYAGDLESIDTSADVRIAPLGAATPDSTVIAKPVPAPPSADPLAATVDLFYELPVSPGPLRPGERVSVTLPLRGEDRGLTAPWPAILYDIHGGTWVYEAAASQTFVRRRVVVNRVVDGVAALASGPAAGTAVVTEGAAELFGFELGIGK